MNFFFSFFFASREPHYSITNLTLVLLGLTWFLGCLATADAAAVAHEQMTSQLLSSCRYINRMNGKIIVRYTARMLPL
jgi:threonine/homoserine/homoserine lactone efflux protein